MSGEGTGYEIEIPKAVLDCPEHKFEHAIAVDIVGDVRGPWKNVREILFFCKCGAYVRRIPYRMDVGETDVLVRCTGE